LYAVFHETLIEALASMEVAARLAGGERSEGAFLCFERRSPLDVVAGASARDTKLAGSAQRRVRGAILQHGSILLARSTAAPELSGAAEIAGRAVNPEQLIDAWLPRIAERLAMSFHEQAIQGDELRRIDALAREKFGHPAWLARR